ncbi:MAG: sulfatase-like hydrolase/transferase [Planctomycetota bacterium]
MSTAKPNIVLVMTDQQRFDTIAALGNRHIRTPALDGLCRQGATFTSAYTASPVCVPSRIAMLTGQPPHVTGCVDNEGPKQPVGRPSVMERLGDHGYACHGVGKMHFDGDGPPRLWGFDSRDVSEEDPGPHDDYAAYLKQHGYGHVVEPHGVRSEMYYVPQPSQVPAELHHTRWVADRSLDFLAKRDRSKPFFLFSSFIKPHPPFESPAPWNQLYRCPAMPEPVVPDDAEDYWTYWNRCQNRYKYCDAGRDRLLERTRKAAYYAAISFVDEAVGRILDGLGPDAENTLVVFTSDHGELMGDYGCVGKRSMLDASARVPLIARWPGRFVEGARVETAVSLLSLFPTFLAAAGDVDPCVSPWGCDLTEVVRGRRPGPVFSQYQRGRYALYMATDGRAKWVRSAPDDRVWRLDCGQTDGMDRVAEPDSPVAEAAESLGQALRTQFVSDGYGHAVENGRWVAYEPATEPEPGDHGLLLQDSPQLSDALQTLGPGYKPDPAPQVDPYALLRTPEPFLRRTRPKIEASADVPAPLRRGQSSNGITPLG